MTERFAGKVVLITGGGSGLGRSAAVEVAREGAKLALVDVNMKALEETKRVISDEVKHAEFLLIEGDVSDEEAVKKYVSDTVNEFGRIDAFFNNAGIEGKQNLIENYETEMFNKVIDINLKGVFFGLKHVLPVMKKQGEGYIVNASSVGGIRAVPNLVAYGASKHAVAGMTKDAAIEYAEHGISINAIAPGAILTDMVIGSFKQINPNDWESASKEFVKDNPAKRLGEPKEVGRLVAFLLSGEAPFINGAIIPIDGAQSAKY
ncbi:NAD(P)-dependent dehydrogenase, short-chain alcohol dehydrogenase family [Paenibacillus sp. CF095]|uniref:glucose 1-dehydrogenase n=1 Tax=unclassified Paenibacillus TaxID=185978 RepID=UPI00088D8B78|nr:MULTISPECIES: glucose 1-dehydrogenase [unclassified Paenibacillus]WJM08237.1 glucose 1-dehydrogenase [Paenibacillus sp. PK1-4R]SDD30277.1 NAD(P)-dependent dehydrogenase, short-chain alcohol dehydrogenase family [Paenibacillus sp. CF095]